MKYKYCGNCKHFVDKKVGGYGICNFPNMLCGAHRNNKACRFFAANSNNGWTEITQDNVEGLNNVDPCRLMIATIDSRRNPQYAKYDGMSTTLDAIATIGGCYGFVLPELRLEE